MGSADWNPRYLAYCAAHGRTPEEMRAFDAERHPVAPMLGYILWFHAREREFTADVPGHWTARLRKVDPEAFDAYLRSFAVDGPTLGLVS